MKKILPVILLCLTLALIFTACAKAPGEKIGVATIAIETPDKTVLAPLKVDIYAGEKAADVLKRITKDKKIHLDMETGAFVYVKGIDNLYEKDRGPESGWLYMVNGEMPLVGCDQYEMVDGDMLEFRFVDDWNDVM